MKLIDEVVAIIRKGLDFRETPSATVARALVNENNEILIDCVGKRTKGEALNITSNDIADATPAGRVLLTAEDEAEQAGRLAPFLPIPDPVTIPTIVVKDDGIEFFGYPTEIANDQFDFFGVTGVQIGNSVTSIGSAAFRYNSLASVVIPDSVTSIGSHAFRYNSLTSVVIPDSVTSIGSYAFSGNSLTSVVIPDSVTSIGDYAFRDNQLTSVVIPDSVTSIGSHAFANNSDLATVNCYVPKTIIDASTSIFLSTASTLTIHARASDGTWTAGTDLTIGGNTSVDVVKDL